MKRCACVTKLAGTSLSGRPSGLGSFSLDLKTGCRIDSGLMIRMSDSEGEDSYTWGIFKFDCPPHAEPHTESRFPEASRRSRVPERPFECCRGLSYQIQL